MFNPLKRIADDIETGRMNATGLSDEAQPHGVTERFKIIINLQISVSVRTY